VIGAIVIAAFYGVAVFLLGWVLSARCCPNKEITSVQEDEAALDAEGEEEEVVSEAFVIAGKPRKPSWRQRRKELEAAARTKRKRIEEWSD
jgi:hypothetical protein